jgi:hypothetical protein
MAEINLIKLSQSGGGPSLVDVNFNSTLEGQADTTIPIEVNLTDGVNPVTPTSVALTGNDLDIVIPAPIIPSGVLLQFPTPDQYTSYRTGDVGWRAQNNWFNYIPPTNPKVIAELDYSLGADYWARLKNPLIVGGVSNTIRFVDVDGGQTFSATGDKNLITIDKFTGLGMRRITTGNGNWNTQIDNALALSLVVGGVTFSDFYLVSALESILLFGLGRSSNSMTDPISSVVLQSNTSADMFTSTTNENSSTSVHNHQNLRAMRLDAKTLSSVRGIYIFDASSLITAP